MTVRPLLLRFHRRSTERDLADVPDDVLNRLQPIFYTDPINAAIRAMGLD